jgi:hypothetical protein
MRDIPPSSERSRLSRAEHSLLDRIRARVSWTQRELERRDAAPSPGTPIAGRRASSRPKTDAAKASDQPASPEMRALNVVYGMLGRSHRRYRERTGERVPPALQAAARAFKQDPSDIALVPVARYLDDLGLIKW